MLAVLPLFPLNAVLFPGGEMELKISEDCYRQLLEDCLTSGSNLGIIYCEDDVREKASMSEVGCVAKIIDHTSYEDGSCVVRVRGEGRFKLGEIESKKPYISAKAQLLEDIEDLDVNDPLLKMVEELTYIYMDLLAEIDPVMPASGLTTPIRLEDSFLLIEQMILPEDYREEALKVASVKERFELALQYLRVEIERLRFLLEEPTENEVIIN
jgi:Lon protease-like protein